MDKIVELLSGKIVDWLVNNNKIGPEKEELYKYSALISIQSIINILATLLLGFIFGAFLENICFFLVFKILRKYSGGLHSIKFFTCFSISTLTNIVVLIAIKLFGIYTNYYLAIVFEVVSFLLIICFAPVVNANKPISKREYKLYKGILCVIGLIIICISIFLSFRNSGYVFSISLAMLLNSVLLFIEVFRKKELLMKNLYKTFYKFCGFIINIRH